MGMYSRAVRGSQLLTEMETIMAKKSKHVEVDRNIHNTHNNPPIPIVIDEDLLGPLYAMAQDRGLSISRLVNSRIRSLVNAYKKYKVLTLQDDMPYGQYMGMNMEEMIRSDPRYVRFLVANSDIFELDTDAQELLENM